MLYYLNSSVFNVVRFFLFNFFQSFSALKVEVTSKSPVLLSFTFCGSGTQLDKTYFAQLLFQLCDIQRLPPSFVSNANLNRTSILLTKDSYMTTGFLSLNDSIQFERVSESLPSLNLLFIWLSTKVDLRNEIKTFTFKLWLYIFNLFFFYHKSYSTVRYIYFKLSKASI